MIKNIVFDLGQVLLRFSPSDYVHSLHDDQKLAQHLLNRLFLSQYWLDLDRGTIAFEEVLEQLCTSEPEHAAHYTYLIQHWQEILTPIKMHIDLLPLLKQQGYRLFYCSNFQRDSFRNAYQKNEFFTLFEGGVVSYQGKYMKPEPAIYQALLDQYDLVAEECLFIDDAIKNVVGAQGLGFHTIHCKPDSDLALEIYTVLHQVNEVQFG